MTTVPQIAIKSFTAFKGGPICVCVCVSNGIFERKRIPDPSQSSGEGDTNMNKSVSRSSPITPRPRVRASPIAVSLYSTSILFSDATCVREWDVAVSRQICLIILMLHRDLSVFRGRYIWTPYAPPSRTSMQPIFTRLRPSGLHMLETSFKTMFSSCASNNTREIFSQDIFQEKNRY